MSNNEISFESLPVLSERLRKRQLTSTKLVEHFLARTERLDGKLHAFVSIDADGALREAAQADRRHAEGNPRGPLDGLPVAVKDMFDIKGSGVRIVAMKESDFLVPVDPRIVQACREARRTLESLGASVSERPFPFDMNEIIRECGVMMAAEGWKAHRVYIEGATLPFGPWVRERILAGKSLGSGRFERALRLHEKLSARWQEWLADADAFLSPAVPIPALPVAEVDERATTLAAFARAGNFLGACGLTLPAGATEAGLPLAIQLLGKPFDEARLIRIGRAFQGRTAWHLRMPDLTPLLAPNS